MIVADLGTAELRQRLDGPGLGVRTGALAVRISSRLPEVAAGMALHYANHPVVEADEFADFRVSVNHERGWRGWVRPKVVFTFDGDKPFAPLPGDQGFPMLEWGLNWCVNSLCNQYLVIHSAVLERKGRALIMPAPSGSGKSTLCAALAFRGWRLLSDELAVILPKTGQVLPIPRPISLKNRSVDVIRAFAPEAAFGRPVTDTLKGMVCHVRPPLSAVTQADEPAQPRWVVFPKYVAGAPAQLKPLSRAQTFMALMAQTFNYNVHGAQGFSIMSNLVEACQGHEFTYGDLNEAVQVFEDLADRDAAPA